LRADSRPEPLPTVTGSKRVIQVAEGDPRWDDFVLTAPGGTVFHHSGWLAALERESGRRALRLACEEPGGDLSGVLPLMEARGLPLGLGGAAAGPRLSSLPRTPVAGPVGTSEALGALVAEALATAAAAGLRLQLKPAAGALSLLPGLHGSPWRRSYVKPLPADPELLRFGNSRNHGRIAWAVRKAQREGLRVRDAASEADLREWYRLYLDVNRWRGLPARPYRLFLSAWERLRPGGFLRLLLAHREQSGRDRILAGSLLLRLGDTTFYAFNGRVRETLSLRPNDLLQWHAMRDAAAAGYRWYDFGEAGAGNEGLARFKAKWDTQTRMLVRYHAPALPGGRDEYGPAGNREWLRRIAVGAWHRVPLPVTAVAGDQVYRFL
jgi:hypothetical protein